MKKMIIFIALAIAFTTAEVYAAPAELPKTGQTTCYNAVGDIITCTNTGQDGAMQKGVAWADPRFTNADNSTPISGDVVVDQLTGLMWTKDGNAPGPAACNPGATKDWEGALAYVACLNANTYLGYVDWRLPNINELESLVNAEQSVNATWLNTQGFMNAQAGYYRSSTTYAGTLSYAWVVGMHNGLVTYGFKTAATSYAWPVRGGQ